MTTGTLIGIARHARPRAAMEPLDQVHVSVANGLVGDYRGAVKPGGKGRRQVTVMERESWDLAMGDLSDTLPWTERRANLLVEGIALPREVGAILKLGSGVVLQVTGECDPCSRMEEIAPGLKAALMPDWRGGVTCRVVAAGDIALGDAIMIGDKA